MEISNSVIVITGASTGIGRAVATQLHDLGAHLVLAARSAAPLHALADELDGSLAVPTDVTDPQAAAHLVDAAIERFGRIDVLINNAGRAMARPVEHIDLAELTDLIELNVIAPLRLLQLVAPRMREQGTGHDHHHQLTSSHQGHPVHRRLRRDEIRSSNTLPHRPRGARRRRDHRERCRPRHRRHRLRAEHPQPRARNPPPRTRRHPATPRRHPAGRRRRRGRRHPLRGSRSRRATPLTTRHCRAPRLRRPS